MKQSLTFIFWFIMWMLQIVLSSDSPCGNKDKNYESNYPKTPNC
jgi:hypothetical protein